MPGDADDVGGGGKTDSPALFVKEFTAHLRERLDELGCRCEPSFMVIEPTWDPLDDSVPHVLDVRVTHATPCPRDHEEVIQL